MSDTFDHMADAWDDALFGATFHGFGYRGEGYAPRPLCCKVCGARMASWRETEKGWRLIDRNGRLHDCRSAPASANDFDVIED